MADKSKGEESLPLAPHLQETLLAKEEFQRLGDVPLEVEWFANLKNQHTWRAYRSDIRGFMSFIGIKDADTVSLRDALACDRKAQIA